MKRLFFCLTGITALLFVLNGCSGRRGTVDIRVVATSDVHGHIYATDVLDGTERKGSLARFSTFLKRQRKENGNLIYLDAGDFFSGSVETYHDKTAEFYEPSLAATVYNSLGCDAAVFGNHEFSEGADVYMRFLEGCGFPVLGANLKFDNPGDFLPPYCIIERHGVRVAVIGFTAHSTCYTVPADILGTVVVDDIVGSARYWMPILKEKENPDVIIGLLHSGFDNGRFDEQNIEENAASDVVMASDPDADRLGVACRDDKGELTLLNGNQTAMIFLYYIITQYTKLGKMTGKEYIVKTIVTTEVISRIAEKNNLEMFDCYTGFKWIAKVIADENAKGKHYIGGGEETFFSCYIIQGFRNDQARDVFHGHILFWRWSLFHYSQLSDEIRKCRDYRYIQCRLSPHLLSGALCVLGHGIGLFSQTLSR